jgi:hypothetical protein
VRARWAVLIAAVCAASVPFFGASGRTALPQLLRSPAPPDLAATKLSAASCGATLVKATTAAPIRRIGRARRLFDGSTTSSTNWSGYDAIGGGFTSVTATWMQPAIQPSYTSTAAHVSIWAGLDGDGSATVEQTGTHAYTQNGSVSYYAWYEIYPAPEVAISGLAVSPGNSMTGTVTADGYGDFTMTIRNNSTGHYYATTQFNGTTAPYSAEVIAEAPTSVASGTTWPLANFGTISFTNCAFNGKAIGTFAWNRIDMIASSGTTVLAQTSPLGSDSASFSVDSYPTSDATPPTTTVSGADGLWHNQPVSLTFSATDNSGGSGVAYAQYSLDGGATWTQGSSVTIAAPTSHSNDGAHTVLYCSVDNAGNLEAAKSCQVMIDTQSPTTTLVPANGYEVGYWNNVPCGLTFTAVDGGSGLALTQIKLDSGAWTTWSSGTTYTLPAPADHSNDGWHTISYRSLDNVGNLESTQTAELGIDTLGPVGYARSVGVKRNHTCTLWFVLRDNISSQVTSVLVITSRSGVVKKRWSWGYDTVPRQGVWWTHKYKCTLAKGIYLIRVYGKDLALNMQSVVGKAYLRVK